VKRSSAQVADPLSELPRSQVLVLGQDVHAPRLRQPRRDRAEVVSDLGARCSLVESRVLAGLVDPVLAERQGVDAVVGRGGVEPNEGVRVEPMPTRTWPAIDQRDLDIGLLLDQRVGEGEATGPGSDDQIVGANQVSSSRPSVAPMMPRTLLGPPRRTRFALRAVVITEGCVQCSARGDRGNGCPPEPGLSVP
jgi:hypothetical protein